MTDRLLDRPLSRFTFALATGTGLTLLLAVLRYTLPVEPALRFLGGASATSASMGTAFVLTVPFLAREEPFRVLAGRCAQAGSGWLASLAATGLSYLLGHVAPGLVTFLTFTAASLSGLALLDSFKLLTGLAQIGRESSRPAP